jgi:hypothetical protein
MAKSTPAKLAYGKAYREKNREKVRAYFKTDEARKKKSARRLAWSQKNRAHQTAMNRRAHLERYHGLTVEQFEAMERAQGGKCAICGEVPSGKAHCGRLHVDHDHASGAIRDLLCSYCNIGLGKFRDSAARLTKAAWYLERHRAKNRRTA